MPTISMAQVGTGHGHAAGKLRAMQAHPDVEVVGVYEPDERRRAALSGEPGPFAGVRWLDSFAEILDDPAIVAVASEGTNAESLDQTEALVAAGKHVWYDKPAGENWPQWQQVVEEARGRNLHLQMGYMFRYHDGFRRIADWARSGFLGHVFSVRAHMSTHLSQSQREAISVHRGGIFYDLAGHMLDQVVWILGRPRRTTGFFHNHDGVVPAFMDNTLGVLEYDRALATVDIAAMEPRPMARRFEVYGTRGSAILLEPFEEAHTIRLCLDDARDGYAEGVQILSIESQSRQHLYELELAAFLDVVAGNADADRPLDHELLVQETLLRTTGHI